MPKAQPTAEQFAKIGTALEKAVNEVGFKLYDFATGHLIAPNPFLNTILDSEGKEVKVTSYTFILESPDE